MSAAIAALFAALAVVFGLSVITTTSEPIDTFLNVLINLVVNARGRMLTANEAMTALLYAVVIYVVAFSLVYFLLRTLAIFLAAFGIPNEDQVRLNRELRRDRGVHVALAKRQARLTALYTVRAQQAALVAQRRRQARASGKAPISDPSPRDFNL